MSSYLKAPIYRVNLVQDGEVPVDEEPITGPFAIAKIARELLMDADREHFLVFLLDGKNRLVGVNTVSIGCLNSAIVHPREVFKPAVLANACAVVCVHNHPSGDPEPSDMGFTITTTQLAQVAPWLTSTSLRTLVQAIAPQIRNDGNTKAIQAICAHLTPTSAKEVMAILVRAPRTK